MNINISKYLLNRHLLNFSLSSHIVYGNESLQLPYCGNWAEYSEEVCVKIVDKYKLYNFTEAINKCRELDRDSGSLLIIQTKEELNFITNYLTNKENNIFEPVWIGLNKTKEGFKWVNGSSLNFKNWAIGGPSNESDSDCVQMLLKSFPIGQWDDESCRKRNLVVCQKTPDLTIDYIKATLNATQITLDFARDKLKDMKLTSYFDDVYKDKWSFFKVYNDTKLNKHKALMIPLKENKIKSTWDQANTVCSKYNTHLVYIDTFEKQNIVYTFFNQIGLDLDSNWNSFWLNAEGDGKGNWKWIKEGGSLQSFDALNWENHATKTDYAKNRLVFLLTKLDFSFGRWNSVDENSTNYVFCEFEVEI
jgi:hypothetical protein